MDTRPIGSLDVSVVGLGTNNLGSRLDLKQSTDVVNACLDAGINFFDTADVYSDSKSEEFLGRALGKRRAEAVITTKFGGRVGGRAEDDTFGGKREFVLSHAEASLKRLGTDYIDLYLLHRPDPTTPINETLAAMNELVQQGKVREIGCANFTIDLLVEAENAVALGAARLASLENQYSLLERVERGVESDLLPECERAGMGFLPYYPLGSGLLTGKYRRNEAPPEGTRLASEERTRDRFFTDRNIGVVEALAGYVQLRDHTLLEAAISWLLHQPSVASVIAGATSADQVRANVAAASWKMTTEELAELAQITA